MRPIGIGLAVALLFAAFTPASIMSPAIAAAPRQARRAGGRQGSPGQGHGRRARGGPGRPGPGLDCQVADARMIGESTDAKSQGQDHLLRTGLLPVTKASSSPRRPRGPRCSPAWRRPSPKADGKPNTLVCLLPGNVDPKAALAAYVTKGGAANCDVDQGPRASATRRPTPTSRSRAKGGAGYIIVTSAPPRMDKEVQVNPCLMYDPTGNVACKLSGPRRPAGGRRPADGLGRQALHGQGSPLHRACRRPRRCCSRSPAPRARATLSSRRPTARSPARSTCRQTPTCAN